MSTGSKVRGASDQPATCPLCGATLRQARNLRRHLEMLHFGAGKIPPPESPSGNNSPSTTNAGHRSTSRGSSHQSVPTSPGAAGTPGSDQSAAAVVVMPSALCQPVMLASPEDPHHTGHPQNQDHHQTRTSPPNLASVLGPPLLPPPSVATSMMGHHHSHHNPFMRYPGYPADIVGRADQHLLRGIYDTRLPRPDPGGGMGGTEM